MIRLFILINTLVIFPYCFSYSQKVVEHILFDNYTSATVNDLTNHFYGMQALSQIPNNGISGGCLITPTINNWGNDNSRYCSKYQSLPDSTSIASIYFYYDTSLVVTGFDRTTAIWLQPSADFNHYIIVAVENNSVLTMYTYYTYVASPTVMNLQNNHWYELQVQFSYSNTPLPYTLSIAASVYDWGVSGIGPPAISDSIFESLEDSVFALDPSIEVSITASQNGGCRYLDNFSFEGIKSADSCNFTNIESDVELIPPGLSIQHQTLVVTVQNSGNGSIEIFDLNGRKLINYQMHLGENSIDISALKSGMYIVRINQSKYIFNSKIFIPN